MEGEEFRRKLRRSLMEARLCYWSGVGNVAVRKSHSMMPFDVEVFANSMQIRRMRTKKYRGPDSPLYTALYPMICIIKLFGLAPYEFSRDQMVPSNTMLIFSFLFSSMYMYEMFVVYIGLRNANRDRVASWTSAVMVFFNFGVAIYEILLAIFTRKSYARVWNAIQDYDEAVRQLGYPRKEIRIRIVAWIVLIIQSCIWASVNLASMYAFGEKWIYSLAYISIYLGTTVAVYKFSGTTYILAQRFAHLTDLAVKNLPPRSGFMNPGKVTRKTVQNLHNELMVAGECLDSMYRWSLFFWLANLSMHSVSNIYFITKWLMDPASQNNYFPLIICYSAWLLSFVVQLLIIHVVCDYASKRANDIDLVLIDWNVRLAKRFPETEVVESSVHLLNRKLQFSAAGCFDVDLPLLRSIVAVLSTYLVILLQLPT